MAAEMILPPYAQQLGLKREGNLLVMPYISDLIGSPGRLHGGAVAGLMEIAANLVVREALEGARAALKPINVTVDYLREGALVDTYAEAIIMRMGRRIANVRVEAWQTDRNRLIAASRMNMLIIREPSAEDLLAAV